MSKSIYRCVVEGDPICTGAKFAHEKLHEARNALFNLHRILNEIEEREDEETSLGFLKGQVYGCLEMLTSHTKNQPEP